MAEVVAGGTMALEPLIERALDALGVANARPLKTGGQKTVVAGELNGTPVAAKVIDVGPVAGQSVLERARREVEALSRAAGPHVVRVLTDMVVIDAPSGEPAVAAWAEEFVDGEDLHALVGSPWDWAQASRMMSEVARGLVAFHDNAIVHRDLSPGNVRRRTDGRFVVLDPGYARFIDYTTITTAGQPCTPGHASPEHYDALRGPGRRSDLYQLGILGYLALTGELPVPAGPAYPMVVLRGTVPGVASRRPDLTMEQARVVDRCRERRAARRYRSATDLITAISEATP